jgi:putative membrane protein
MRLSKRRLVDTSLAVIGIAVTAPVWAVSLASIDAQSQPQGEVRMASLVPNAGSASLVPLMAAEVQANSAAASVHAVQAQPGDVPVGKPLDDLSFVRLATENGRKEASAARYALPQLTKPEFKRVAEMMFSDGNDASQRLFNLVEQKQWPVPGPRAEAAPAAGTASGDFDTAWTAEMIASQERSLALYRAQAATGEDKDLRNFARDTVPVIERHLNELKGLPK